MRDSIIYGFLGAAVITAFLFCFFVWTWAEHASYIQEMIAEDIAYFSENDIDWDQVNLDEDPEMLLTNIREMLIAELKILHVEPTRIAMQEYKETLFDLIYTLTSDPSNKDAIARGILNANTAKIKFYMVVDRFQNSTLYAMKYTL